MPVSPSHPFRFVPMWLGVRPSAFPTPAYPTPLSAGDVGKAVSAIDLLLTTKQVLVPELIRSDGSSLIF